MVPYVPCKLIKPNPTKISWLQTSKLIRLDLLNYLTIMVFF